MLGRLTDGTDWAGASSSLISVGACSEGLRGVSVTLTLPEAPSRGLLHPAGLRRGLGRPPVPRAPCCSLLRPPCWALLVSEPGLLMGASPGDHTHCPSRCAEGWPCDGERADGGMMIAGSTWAPHCLVPAQEGTTWGQMERGDRSLLGEPRAGDGARRYQGHTGER